MSVGLGTPRDPLGRAGPSGRGEGSLGLMLKLMVAWVLGPNLKGPSWCSSCGSWFLEELPGWVFSSIWNSRPVAPQGLYEPALLLMLVWLKKLSLPVSQMWHRTYRTFCDTTVLLLTGLELFQKSKYVWRLWERVCNLHSLRCVC